MTALNGRAAKPRAPGLVLAALLALNGLLLGPPAASGDEWAKVDVGPPDPVPLHLSGLAMGDGDRDNATELYAVGMTDPVYTGHVYRYSFENESWAGRDLGAMPGSSPMDTLYGGHIAVGDGDGDGTPEVYATAMIGPGMPSSRLYQYAKGGNGWCATAACDFDGWATALAIGDGDSDGRPEMYLSHANGTLYQVSRAGTWSLQYIGRAPMQYIKNGGYWQVAPITGLSIGDGDSDGRNELYGSCLDNHIYRFNRTASGWERADLGGEDGPPQSTSMNGLTMGDLDGDGQNELYGLSTLNGTLWQYTWSAGAGRWDLAPTVNISGTYVAWSVSLCTARNPSASRNELFLGTANNQVYRMFLDNATGKWDCSAIGSGTDLIRGVAGGTLSGDPDTLEVYAACHDGHLYSFFRDLAPPANPAVWSDTHPAPGKWYNRMAVHVLWKDGARDISGIDGYSFAWDTNAGTVPDDLKDCEQAVHEWTANLSDGDGWYFHIRARDNALNWNLSAAHYGPIGIDTVAPDVPELLINGGAPATSSASVGLSILAGDPGPGGSGLDAMAFSNDGRSWSAWEPFCSTRPGWDLADAKCGGNGSDGPKTVFVRARDVAGNELPPEKRAKATIILDRVAPSGLSLAINDGAAYSTLSDVALSLNATDTVSGVSGMAFSNDGAVWSEWSVWATFADWSLTAGAGGTGDDGPRTVFFRAQDLAGNVGGPANATIFLDRALPSDISVVINGGARYANSSVAWLAISARDPEPASGLSRMALSGDPAAMGPWEGWADHLDAWDLTDGPGLEADGPRTVRLDVEDRAGNSGGPAFASIFLDRAPPARLSIVINAGSPSTNDTNVTLALAAEDPGPGSGLDRMQFSSDGAGWTGWEPFAATRTYSLAVPDGTKSIFFRVKDRAGNVARAVNATILLDTAVTDLVPPVISGVRVTNITNNSAVISWTTDEPADSLVEYGPGYELSLNLSTKLPVLNHTVTLTGLSANTVYRLRVRSADQAGNPSQPGEILNFTTGKNPAPRPNPPKDYTVTMGNTLWLVALALVVLGMVAAAAYAGSRGERKKG